MMSSSSSSSTRICGSTLTTAVALLLCASSAPAQRTALIVDPATSHLYAVTHRTGLLKFLGHEHVISATRWHAELCLDPSAETTSYARFVVDTRALVIDSDSARQIAGLGDGPSRDQRREIQSKMVDSDHLNVGRFPEMTFESAGVTLNAGRELHIQGELTIRGVTQKVTFPASLKREATDRVVVSASINVKQSAFGIKPESIAGVVKVSDAFDIHVRLSAIESKEPCR